MQRRGSIIPIFSLFLILSLLIIFLAQKGALHGFTGLFEQLTVPIQRFAFTSFHFGNNHTSEDTLREENAKLLTQLAKQKEIEKENQALHDQFQVEHPSPQELLPATVIGNNDDQLILDKGSADGIKKGSVIVFKDNLIGKVIQVSKHISVVQLVTNPAILFTAQTAGTHSLGVVKGAGGGAILFGNVVLSEKVQKGDIIQTKGDVDAKGKGFPPDLIVGKVISVNKKASALFQTAEVQSLVDFTKLKIVFVMKE
jgi:rod shape-determining protein MreC